MILALTVLLCGCRGPGSAPSHSGPTRIVKDDLGREIALPFRIDHAISLAPSLTEIIFSVGAGDRLVGVTTYCNYPPEAQAIRKVSDTQTPNIESILALRPQVVFVTTASQLESFTRTLEEQGISVYVTNPASLDDVFASMVRLGELFGDKVRAEAAAAGLSQRVRDIEQKRSRESPRVFVQISNEPLFTIGKDSFLAGVVESAGGISVTANVPTAYPKLSKETALALNPEVIILSDSDDNREPNAVFNDSPAVRSGRVYRINADIVSRPGPRLVDALEQISAFLQDGKSIGKAGPGK